MLALSRRQLTFGARPSNNIAIALQIFHGLQFHSCFHQFFILWSLIKRLLVQYGLFNPQDLPIDFTAPVRLLDDDRS